MAVPTSNFSLISVCDEIYGSGTHTNKTLKQCFADAIGTFQGSGRSSLKDFAGYIHFVEGPNFFSNGLPGWSWVKDPFEWNHYNSNILTMITPAELKLKGSGTSYIETTTSFTGEYEFSYTYEVQYFDDSTIGSYVDPSVCQVWSQLGNTRLTANNNSGKGTVTGRAKVSNQKLRFYMHSILSNPEILFTPYNMVFKKVGP